MFNGLSTEYDEVRLVGGTNRCNGVLELLHNGEWRSEGGYEWNLKSESEVVCKQLNCGSAVHTEKSSVATDRDLRSWRFTSSCVGSESSLRECGTLEDIGSSDRRKVTCSGNKQQL